MEPTENGKSVPPTEPPESVKKVSKRLDTTSFKLGRLADKDKNEDSSQGEEAHPSPRKMKKAEKSRRRGEVSISTACSSKR